MKKWLLLGMLVLLSCSLSGIGSNPAGEYGVEREDAIFLAGGQPRTLDPALTHGGPSGVIGHVFGGLVRLDQQLQIQPDLVAGWEVSDDGRTYTFYLRRSSTFHDGRPLTAHDVVYSWERATDPATQSDTAQTYLGDIVGVREKLEGSAPTISGLTIIDDYTLQVEIDAPKVYFLAKLAYPVAYIVDQDNVSQTDWEHTPNGSGSFKLIAWEDDEIVVLEQHANHHAISDSSVKHIVYLIGAGLPLSLYETGQIDLVGVGGANLDRVRDPNDLLHPDLVTGVSMCTSFIGLNSRIAPFDDVRVRQAFNYALDKDTIVNTLFGGNALTATGALPPGMPGYTGTNRGYPFDPQRAQALLAEAGYTPETFPTLTYTTSGYNDVSSFVSVAITMWQENLGVTVEPVLLDPFIYQDELYAGNIGNLFGYGWCADYPDPENFLDVLFHSQSLQNRGGFADPEIDALLEQARVESDVNKRLALYAEIEQKLVGAAPTVFVSHSLSAVLVKPALQNYVLTPIGIAQWPFVTLAR